MYNAYVPIFLKYFKLSSFVIGIIMTVDNIFAILLLPFLGALSDRTRTRLGRRRPYILAGAPLAMLFFLLIPYARLFENLALMMFTIIIMNLAMALFRTPVVALMPDITPSHFRSQQSLSRNRSLPFTKTLTISFQGIEACFSSSFLYSFGLLVLTVLRPSLPVMLNFIWG